MFKTEHSEFLSDFFAQMSQSMMNVQKHVFFLDLEKKHRDLSHSCSVHDLLVMKPLSRLQKLPHQRRTPLPDQG